MSGSINERLKKDVKLLEVHVWRALRDSGPAVFEYTLEDDEALTFAIDGKVLDSKSEPTLKDYMENTFKPWTTYEMHDVHIIEVGLMAATTVYKVTAKRDDKDYTLLCSSSWAQGADAEWKLKVHAEGQA